MDIQLFDHQKKLVDQFPRKILLCWDTGIGKTLASIMLSNKGQSKTLIICPKALKKQWEISMGSYSTVEHLVITKEEFKRDINEIARFDCLIVDEAHYFFGMKSVLSKALIFYLKKWQPKYLYLLTATPYRSSPWDVYRMLEIMGRKILWPTFYRQFFYEVSMGMRKVPMAKKTEKAKNDLITLIKSVGSVVSLEDCFDVPEQTFDVIYLELTKAQKKAIEKIEAVMPIERYGQEHQITGGVTKGDEYKEGEMFETNKIPVLLELIRDNPRIMVVCKYRAEINMLKDIILEEFDNNKKEVAEIHGDVKDRHLILQAFDKLDDYVLLVAAQCSEGWELPECPLMVFYSHDWALTNFIQIKGRILRANHLKKNIYISLVCKDTIDEDVYRTVVIDKADFHARIYKDTELSTSKVSTSK